MTLLDDPIFCVSAGLLLEDGQYAGHVLQAHEGHDDPEMERNFAQAMQEAYEIFCTRHEGYGRGNISQIGLAGVMDRMVDKFERLKRILEGKQGDTLQERADDAFIDVCNCALIGLLIKRGTWPVEERQPQTMEEELRKAIFHILVTYGCNREAATRLADDTAGQLHDHAQE